jgi:hypothetical protein
MLPAPRILFITFNTLTKFVHLYMWFTFHQHPYVFRRLFDIFREHRLLSGFLVPQWYWSKTFLASAIFYTVLHKAQNLIMALFQIRSATDLRRYKIALLKYRLLRQSDLSKQLVSLTQYPVLPEQCAHSLNLFLACHVLFINCAEPSNKLPKALGGNNFNETPSAGNSLHFWYIKIYDWYDVVCTIGV